MSHRLRSPNRGWVGGCGLRSGLWAWALLFVAITCTVAPGAARADAIVLSSGEVIEGAIVDTTRNTVIVRRAAGGMRQMPIRDIVEIRIVVRGQPVVGKLLGWTDGVYQVHAGDEILRIGAGRILTREHRSQAVAPSGRASAQIPRQRSPAPQLAKPPVVKVARAVTKVAPAQVERTDLGRPQPNPQTAPAAGSAIEGAGLRIAAAKDEPPAAAKVETPAAATSPDVRPAEIVAAAAAGAPAAKSDATVGTSRSVGAEDSAEAVSPAAAHPVGALAEMAVPRASAAEIGPSEVPAGGRPTAADRVNVPVPPARVVGAIEGAAPPPATGDDPRPAVTASVNLAAADPEDVVFRIELSRPAGQTVVLIYGTVDGTARAGKDYEPQQGVLTLAPGRKSADVRVPLIEHQRPQDTRFELFLTADPKVAKIVHQHIGATIPATD